MKRKILQNIATQPTQKTKCKECGYIGLSSWTTSGYGCPECGNGRHIFKEPVVRFGCIIIGWLSVIYTIYKSYNNYVFIYAKHESLRVYIRAVFSEIHAEVWAFALAGFILYSFPYVLSLICSFFVLKKVSKTNGKAMMYATIISCLTGIGLLYYL